MTDSSSQERFNPFPGLRAFEPDEDHLFFGREREIDELLRRLRRTRFLAVIGGSGSGKSSLVRCGLIPSLYGGMMTHGGSNWRIAILRPGEDPVGNLAAALDAPDILGQEGELSETNRVLLEATLRRGSLGLRDCVRQAGIPERNKVLVFVDQFEELFRFKRSRRFHNSHDEALAFVKLLLDSSHEEDSRVHVVLTMRSDYIDQCMDYPGLPEAINQSQYLIPRMTRDQLRASITGPVAVGGGEIARPLVVRLLNEVGDDPDQLPVLQHALRRTWDSWQSGVSDGPIDLTHYEAIGTMEHAMSRHADEAYAELESDDARRLAEKLFKTLTDASQSGGGVRRPTSVAEAAAICGAQAKDIETVVEAFRQPGRSFLTPPAGTPLEEQSVLDLSHESLMRCWRKLIDWADEERLSAASYGRLSRAATRHAAGEASLWRDPELELGLQWWAANSPTAAWAHHIDDNYEQAQAFLDASRVARDTQRRNKRLLVSGGLAAVLLIASTIGWLGLEAQRGAREVRANAIMVAARSADDPVVRALLVPEAGAVSARGMSEVRPLIDGKAIAELVFRGHTGAINSVAYHPDGTRVATAADDGAVLLWTTGDGASQSVFSHASEATKVALSSDGSQIAAGYRDGTVHLARVPSAGEPVVLSGHGQAVESLAFSPDGALVVTGSLDGTARLWTTAGQPVATLQHQDWLRGAAFDASGSRVLTASADGYARLWAADGAFLAEFRHPDRVTSAVFDPGGERVLTASDDGAARLWSLDGQSQLRVFRSPSGGALVAAAFDATGDYIVTAGESGVTQVWRIEGELIGETTGDGPIHAVTFGPGDSQVLIASADGTGRLWTAGNGGAGTTLKGHGAAVLDAAYSPDGRFAVTVSADTTARVWSSRGAGEPLLLRGGPRSVTGAAYSPTAAFPIATASIDGTARLWDAEGRQQRVFEHGDWVRSVEFSLDGSALLTSAHDGHARIWPLTDGAEPTVLGDGGGRLTSAAFSPDGSAVVAVHDEAGAVVWPAGGGEGIALAAEGDVAWAGFTSDGRSVMTASTAGIERWPAEGQISPTTVLSAERIQEHGGGSVTWVAISPDGRSLATASTDGRVRVWPIDGAGEARLLVGGGDAPLTQVVYSPDGGRLAAAAEDGMVRVWNVGDSEPIDELDHDAIRVNALRFSADGKGLVTAAADGAARVWRIGWDAMLDYLRGSSRSCLTAEQRATFLGESANEATAGFEACESARSR